MDVTEQKELGEWLRPIRHDGNVANYTRTTLTMKCLSDKIHWWTATSVCLIICRVSTVKPRQVLLVAKNEYFRLLGSSELNAPPQIDAKKLNH